MVVSNNPNADPEKKSGKGKAKEILVDPASLEALAKVEKNLPMQAVVNPLMVHAYLVKLAADPNNVITDTTTNEAGETVVVKQVLKRTAYTNMVRKALAAYVEFTGDLARPTSRGGNVIGIGSAFNTTVGTMFAFARSMGAATNQNEDQIKALAFTMAKESLAQNAVLASIEVSDEVLEKLWAGADVDLEEDEEEDDEEDDADE